MIFTPYLLFNGTCADAMSFYQSCFGGELSLTRVGDSPMKEKMPKELERRVIHARLTSDLIDITASDWLHPTRTPIQGNMVCLYLSDGTYDALTILYDKLSVDATVIDPLTEQFFGIYGAFTDRYGIRWMFQGNKRS